MGIMNPEMDEASRRKRNRKRPRRGKGAGAGEADDDDDPCKGAAAASTESEAEVALQAQPSSDGAPVQGTTLQQAQPGSSSSAGPSLSFYERTNPHKPSALPSLTASTPRRYTVSIALPGSIVLNAQTPELQSRLAGQIARSCAIFNVDEIIVFDEGRDEGEEQEQENSGYPQRNRKRRFDEDGNDDGFGAPVDGAGDVDQQPKSRFDPNAFLARILQYVETPQYLRKTLFPMHRDLRLAGLLPPLDCPHHLRFEDQSPFREGICVEAPRWAPRETVHLCYVHVGLRDPIACNVKGARGSSEVPVGARVTVKMPRPGRQHEPGLLVSPRIPVEERGLYWGYAVRLCSSLSEVISGSMWSDPYDLVIGTSERGSSLTDLQHAAAMATNSGNDNPTAAASSAGASSNLVPFKHALVVLGGLSGLEVAVERDPGIPLAADEASQLFDAWVNIVEGQGSRTIRTEEALLIALSRLRPTLDMLGKR